MLAVWLAAAALYGMAPQAVSASGAVAPAGARMNGMLSFASDDWSARPIAAWNGRWELYWRQLLTPGDFAAFARRSDGAAAASLDVLMAAFAGGRPMLRRLPVQRLCRGPAQQVPAEWQTYLVDGKQLPNQGFATYRLRIELPSAYARTALYVPSVAYTACG